LLDRQRVNDVGRVDQALNRRRASRRERLLCSWRDHDHGAHVTFIEKRHRAAVKWLGDHDNFLARGDTRNEVAAERRAVEILNADWNVRDL
jgi:hypothetical protein